MRFPRCFSRARGLAWPFLGALVFTGGVAGAQSQSATTDPLPQKVLAASTETFNPDSVDNLLQKGDEAVAENNLELALSFYDDARSIAMNLVSFYRDLSGAFRGLDARIPKEMDANGRRAIELQAAAGLRLAALYRRLNQPEVAVPLLVEVVRLMTPINPEGIEAYQQLVELGFALTTYRGGQ